MTTETDRLELEALTPEERALARSVVTQLHVLLEASGARDEREQSYLDRAVSDLAVAIHTMADRGARSKIEERGGGLTIGGRRFPVDIRVFPAYAALHRWMSQHGLSSLELVPDEAGLDATKQALRMLARIAGDGVPISATEVRGLRYEIANRRPTSVQHQVSPQSDTASKVLPVNPPGMRSLSSRLGSVYLSQPLVDAAVEIGAVDLRIAKGIVQGVVDRLHVERALLPGITRLQSGGKAMLRHAAAVCLYSVLLGRRLGLSEELLLALGAGALLHDVGRRDAEPPLPIGTPRDESHATAGFILLIRAGCRSELELRAAEIVRRHHEPLDAAPLGDPDGPALLPAIVAVADAFDHASHSGGRFTPEAGLWLLRRAAYRGEMPALLVDAFAPALEQAATLSVARRFT
jgi:HD-GYP domain-containing protein (c-di-GMP phosphodiesterase class II)